MGFFDRKIERDPYGSLNPEQAALTRALGPSFQSTLNEGTAGKTFTGQLNEPIGASEQGLVDEFNTQNQARINALISGNQFDPNTFNQQFTNEIAQPTLDFFNREVSPHLTEAVPFSSSARANIVSRNLLGLQEGLLQNRFAAREAAKNRQITASGAIDRAQESALRTAGVPREIIQAGLGRNFANFVNAQGQLDTSIQQMLQFLGLSTVTERSSPSGFENVLAGAEAAANVISASSGGGTSKQDIPKSQSELIGMDTSRFAGQSYL